MKKAAQIKSGPHELPGDERRARALRLPVFPYSFCVAPYGGSPLLTCRKHRSRPTYDDKHFYRMWVRFFINKMHSTRDAREACGTKLPTK